MKLYLIPQDKANHFIYGLGMALLALLCTPYRSPGALFFAACAAAAILGVVTEIWQYRINQRSGQTLHTVSIEDAFATALGGLAVGIPVLLS